MLATRHPRSASKVTHPKVHMKMNHASDRKACWTPQAARTRRHAGPLPVQQHNSLLERKVQTRLDSKWFVWGIFVTCCGPCLPPPAAIVFFS